jgi:uncharacterized protein YcnI
MLRKNTPAKVLLGILAAAAACLTSVAPASAHASIQLYGSNATVAKYGHMFIRIPHGCEGGLATDTIKVQLPAAFTAVKPQAKAGWNVAVAKATGQPTEVTWSGGSLPDTNFDDFGISVKYPSAAGTYAIPTVQYCGTASAAWVEVAAHGQDSHSLAKPAPTVTVAAPAAPSKWTGEVAAAMHTVKGKKQVSVVADLPSTWRNKPVSVQVDGKHVKRVVLDKAGDLELMVPASKSGAKGWKAASGSTVSIVHQGKTVVSTTIGAANGSTSAH